MSGLRHWLETGLRRSSVDGKIGGGNETLTAQEVGPDHVTGGPCASHWTI